MPLLEQVLEKYPDDVKIVFKNFPLRNHKFALKAATAALAAQSQGKFWEFHDLLFKNYNKLNDQKISEIALELGLDQTEFEKKMKDPKITAMIRRDVRDGAQAGVRGTPTIFINGRRLNDRFLEGFQAAIDKELQKLGIKAAKPTF
ncbi:MAG: thioredoxin domain-containing protein [Deltaproteobacteria bacterium]|nr:thioredoxin domain-containing protein [Deltaproteobacteria bacterium]